MYKYHGSLIKVDKVSAALLCLFLRRSMMLASSVVLVLNRVQAFFSSLQLKMSPSVFAINHMMGRRIWSVRWRSRRTTFCGTTLGRCLRRIFSSHWPTSRLYKQVKRACGRLETSCDWQSVQTGLSMFLSKRWSLSWVGRMLCTIHHVQYTGTISFFWNSLSDW